VVVGDTALSYCVRYNILQGMTMDHALAVKQYSRSSAAQEEPLPHDLRPPHILRMTMDYLLVKLMDRCENKDENLGEWYHFLWDRTRGIRKVRVRVEVPRDSTLFAA